MRTRTIDIVIRVGTIDIGQFGGSGHLFVVVTMFPIFTLFLLFILILILLLCFLLVLLLDKALGLVEVGYILLYVGARKG